MPLVLSHEATQRDQRQTNTPDTNATRSAVNCAANLLDGFTEVYVEGGIDRKVEEEVGSGGLAFRTEVEVNRLWVPMFLVRLIVLYLGKP